MSEDNEQNIKFEGRGVEKVENKDEEVKTNDNKEKKGGIIRNLSQTAVVEFSESLFSKYSCGFDFLKPYFDLNTSDFMKRFFAAFIPFNTYFYGIIEVQPDLWGPVWIYTFLVFLIAACGSIVKYLGGINIDDSFFQEFVPVAAALIYGIGFILPLMIWGAMKCFGSESSYATILCTYGYSMGIYIPVLIACSIPIGVSDYLIIL